jgi:ABC-2 type transport system permease protein
MYRLFAAVRKEVLILLRDKSALGILFVMPLTFVVIMSLALQNTFKPGLGEKTAVLLLDADGGAVGARLAEHLSRSTQMKVTVMKSGGVQTFPDTETIRSWLINGRYQFVLSVPANQTQVLRAAMRSRAAPANAAQKLSLYADPLQPPQKMAAVESGIKLAMLATEMHEATSAMAPTATDVAAPGSPMQPLLALQTVEIGKSSHTPTSTQHNVPAYTLLAMFFLVIPLSGTFIKEREQGTLRRMLTLPAPTWVTLAGKVIPYFAINQVQVIVMLCAGIFLLPVLGADALNIGNSASGIALLSVCASCAAIGFGMLVSVFARTTEQASSFGAISILIFAALGGIMVPQNFMPLAMRHIAEFSPLAWGLDGFLDIFVREKSIGDIFSYAARLILFGLLCLTIASLRLRKLK